MPALDIEFTFPTKGSETCQFSYDTINQITGTGIERTMPKRLEYKLAIDFDTFTTRCHTDFIAIRDFYLGQAKGSENSFWYRCPVEYKINSFDVEPYQATGDAYVVGKYGILSYTGTGTDFQAMVVYHIGVNGAANSQRLGFKTVLRVDGSTLSIRNLTTNAQVTGFTLGNTSDTRGIITLPAGSNLSHNYRWTGEYLHRMRFDSDLNAAPVRGLSELYEISGLRMVEKPHTAHRAFANPNWFLNINKKFNPPAQPNYSINYAYFNKEDTLSINKELITRDETEVTATFTTENTIVHHTVKQYYMTWFNAMRGSLLTFEMLDQQARMSDVISFKTEAWKTCEKFVFNSFDITLKGDRLLVVENPNTSPFYINGTNPTTNVQTINPQSVSDPTLATQAFYLNHGQTTPTNPSGNGAYTLTVYATNPSALSNNAVYTNGVVTTAITTVNPRIHALIIGDDNKYYYIARTNASLISPYNSRIVLLEMDFATGTLINKYVSPVINPITIGTNTQPQEPSLGRVIKDGKYAKYEFWTTAGTSASLGNQEVNCFYVDSSGVVQRVVVSNASLTANSTGKYKSSTASNSYFPIPFHFDGVNTYYCFDHSPGVQDTYSASISGTNFVISPYQSSYQWAQQGQPVSSFTSNAAMMPSLRFPMQDKSPSNNATPVIGNQYPIGIKFDATPTGTSGGASWKHMGFSVNIGTNTIATGKTNVRYWQGDATYPSQLSLDARTILTVNSTRYRGIQAHVMPQSGRIFMTYMVDGAASTVANDSIPATGNGFIGHHYGYAVTASRTNSTILDSFVRTGLGNASTSDFATSPSLNPGVNDITKKVLGGALVHVNDNPSGDIIGEIVAEGTGATSRQVVFKRRGTNHFIAVNAIPFTSATTTQFRSTNFIWIPQYSAWLHIRFTDNSNIYMYFITVS